MHQLGVKVEGWKPITPVTVDKVGTYFRHAASEIQHRVGFFCIISPKTKSNNFVLYFLVATNIIYSYCI